MASNPHIITLEEGWDNQIKKKVRTAGGGGAPGGEGFVSAPHARVDFVLGTTWGCGIGLLMTTWTRSRT